MLPEWGQIQRQRLFVIISDKEKGLYFTIPFYYTLQLCIWCYSIQIVPPWHKLLPELPQRKHVKYRLAPVGYFRDYHANIPKNGRKKTCPHARQISNPHLCVIHDDPLLWLQWIEEKSVKDLGWQRIGVNLCLFSQILSVLLLLH